MTNNTSETSELNINYNDSDNNKDKIPTTDTDFYFSLIANPNKIQINNNNNNNDSSEIIEEIINSSSSNKSKISNKSSNKSSLKYDKVNLINNNSQNNIPINNNFSNNIPINNNSVNNNQVNNIPINNNSVNNDPVNNISINNNPINNNPINNNSINNNLINNNINNNLNNNTVHNIPINNIPINNNPVNNNLVNNISNTISFTPHQIKIKKIELLRKLSELKIKGFQLSKEYDYNSSIEEMEYEYELLRSFVDKRNGVKIFKNSLLQAVSVVEFLNDKYDPFDFHLSGWGEHMSIEVDSWEDVMEELYEKYKGSGRKMAPEIKLLYLIIASAAAFHFTKSNASSLPGLDKLLASNPSLISNIINSKNERSQFMSEQELHIEKQKEILKNKDNDIKKLKEELLQEKNKQSNYFTKPSNIVNTTIQAPDQVKNILNKLHNIKPTNTETQEDSSSSNNDRIISESNIINDKKKVGRKKKI